MHVHRLAGILGLLLPVLVSGQGCSPAMIAFEVRQTDPRPGATIALNQELCLAFSHFLEPSSVNDQTILVLDEEHRPVPGRFRVEGKLVFFQPRPPLAADLKDGGFKLGALYRLEVPGFPLLNTVRARGFEARTVSRSFRMEFRTSAGTPGDPPLLVDASNPRIGPFPLFSRREPAGFWSQRIAPGANPRILFSRPLDPRAVSAPGPFFLATLQGRRIEINAVRLVSQGIPFEELGRVVELVPVEPLKPGDAYRLEIFGGPWLHDYAGNPVQALPGDGPSTPVLLQVDPRSGEEFFTDVRGATEETAPGQAWAWWGRGGLTACLLDAAGEGELGPFAPTRDVVLVPGGRVDVGRGSPFLCPGRDLHFSRIEIPKGVTVTLAAGEPWILRSQGPATVEGTLRVVGRSASAPFAGGTYQDPASLMESRLERLRFVGLVLVASGNLFLGGHLDFPGGGGALLMSGGQVLVRDGARVIGGWLECADRRPPNWRLDLGSAPALVTSLLPADQAGGWVSEPLIAAVVSTLRELPQGLGGLRVPVLHALPSSADVSLHLQGAPADPFDPSQPDLSRLTPWFGATNAGALEGCRFFRFRVRILVPAGKGAEVPRVTALLLERG